MLKVWKVVLERCDDVMRCVVIYGLTLKMAAQDLMFIGTHRTSTLEEDQFFDSAR